MVAKAKFFVFSICIALILNGCALFTSHYDATRHENFTKLKAVHVKLFENWSEGSQKVWNESEIKSYCEEADLKFREAYEFAKSKDNSDKTGQRAVKILWDEFNANYNLLLNNKKILSKTIKEEMLSEIEINYGYAISGELSRVNAPQ